MHWRGNLNIDQLATLKSYQNLVYANSKLCLVHFARELANKLKDSNVKPTNIVNTVAGKTCGFILNLYFNYVMFSKLQSKEPKLPYTWL